MKDRLNPRSKTPIITNTTKSHLDHEFSNLASKFSVILKPKMEKKGKSKGFRIIYTIMTRQAIEISAAKRLSKAIAPARDAIFLCKYPKSELDDFTNSIAKTHKNYLDNRLENQRFYTFHRMKV